MEVCLIYDEQIAFDRIRLFSLPVWCSRLTHFIFLSSAELLPERPAHLFGMISQIFSPES